MATKKIKSLPIKNQPKKRVKRNTVTVNFDKNPELYEKLIGSAKLNFRTPEEQILYCIWKQTTPEKNGE